MIHNNNVELNERYAYTTCICNRYKRGNNNNNIIIIINIYLTSEQCKCIPLDSKQFVFRSPSANKVLQYMIVYRIYPIIKWL